jgi:hypothetical protein
MEGHRVRQGPCRSEGSPHEIGPRARLLLSPGAAGLVSSLLVPEFKSHLTDIVFDD